MLTARDWYARSMYQTGGSVEKIYLIRRTFGDIPHEVTACYHILDQALKFYDEIVTTNRYHEVELIEVIAPFNTIKKYVEGQEVDV